MYNWAEDLPDELTFCEWWWKATLGDTNGDMDSVAAYVQPSIEGTLMKNKKSPLPWRFKQWKTWWNTKRRATVGTVADMDVYQPIDLLLIGAVCSDSSRLESIRKLMF